MDWIFDLGLGKFLSFCECGNESYGFIKFWETMEWLHNYSFKVVLSFIELVGNLGQLVIFEFKYIFGLIITEERVESTVKRQNFIYFNSDTQLYTLHI